MYGVLHAPAYRERFRNDLTKELPRIPFAPEGLYSSHLAAWRKARREGALSGLRPKKRAREPIEANPLAPKVKRLEEELAAAHTILDVQGKVAGLLGFSLNDGKAC